MYFTTHIDDGVSYRYGNYWRACAAAVSPAAASTAGSKHSGAGAWPPGQPTDLKKGRLVFNTNAHGTVFNTPEGKAVLAQFLEVIRIQPSIIFPVRQFGRMHTEGGSGLRLVNDPAYPCTCSECLRRCAAAGRCAVGRVRRHAQPQPRRAPPHPASLPLAPAPQPLPRSWCAPS